MGKQRPLSPAPSLRAPTALRDLAVQLGNVVAETAVRDRDLTQVMAGQSTGAE